jgi:hypothetical protein
VDGRGLSRSRSVINLCCAGWFVRTFPKLTLGLNHGTWRCSQPAFALHMWTSAGHSERPITGVGAQAESYATSELESVGVSLRSLSFCTCFSRSAS